MRQKSATTADNNGVLLTPECAAVLLLLLLLLLLLSLEAHTTAPNQSANVHVLAPSLHAPTSAAELSACPPPPPPPPGIIGTELAMCGVCVVVCLVLVTRVNGFAGACWFDFEALLRPPDPDKHNT